MGDKNIIIFDTNLEIEEISIKSELELFYDEIKKTNKVREQHLDKFYEMEMYKSIEELPSSTIDAIILEQLLPYSLPILREIPEIESKANYVISQFGKNPRKKIISKEQTGAPGITIKFNMNMNCFYKGVPIGISEGTDVSVIGLAVYKKLYESGLSELTTDKMINGSYSIFNYTTNTYENFHLKMYPNIAVPFTETGAYRFILFKDIKKELNYLKNIMKQMERSYRKTNLELYSYTRRMAKNNITEKEKIPYIALVLANHLGKIIDQNLEYQSNFNLLINISNLGLYDIYNKTMISSELKKKLETELSFRMDMARLKDEQTFNKFKLQMQIFQKKNIAFKKFGKSNLYALSKKEQDMVDIEYVKMIANKAIQPEELKMVYDLYAAIDHDDNDLIETSLQSISKNLNKAKKYDLKNFMYIKKINDFLLNEKGQNLICPHVVDKARLVMEKYSNILEKSKKIRDTLKEQYSSLDITNAFFCKICGEMLFEADNSEDITESEKEGYTNQNSANPLYVTIYREIVYIVSTFISFSSPSVMNLQSIVRNISDLIKGEIGKIESNLFKIKTAISENISLTLNIYIYIYTFAALCQLIYTNQNIMEFKKTFVRKGGNKSEKSPFLVYGAKEKKSKYAGKTSTNVTSAKIKKSEQNVAEGERSVASPDKGAAITEQLKERSKNIKKNKVDLQKIINDALYIIKNIKYSEIHKSEFVTNDSIKSLFLIAYRWVININYVAVSYSNISYFVQNDAVQYVIYGYNQMARKKHAPLMPNFYSHLFPSLLRDKNHEFFKRFPLVFGRNYDTVNKELIDKDISVYSTLTMISTWNDNKYTNDSFKMFLEYMKEELFLEVPTDNKKLDEFYAKYAHLADLEKKKRKAIKKRFLRPLVSYKNIEYPDSKFIYGCICNDADLIYQKIDAKGQPYGEKKQFTASEIQKWLQDKEYKQVEEFKKWELIERKCKDCKKNKISNIEIFYKYYENSCPVSELHEFSADKCVKCGLTKDQLKTHDKAYYDKYSAVYVKTRQIERNLINEELKKYTERSKAQKNIKDETFPKWELTVQKINEFKKLISISENEFNNIGLYEKQEYQSIKDGKLNMKEISEDEFIKRNNHLYEYYLYIIRNYNIIRNSETIIIPPPQLSDLLTKFPTKNLHLCPRINDDFLKKYKYYKKTLKGIELSNFLLSYISSTLLTIYDHFKKINREEMGMYFIKLLIGNIMNAEKKLTSFTVRKSKYSANIEDVADLIAETEGDKENDFDQMSQDGDISAELEYNEEVVDEEPDDPFALGDLDIEMDAEDDEDNLYTDFEDKQS